MEDARKSLILNIIGIFPLVMGILAIFNSLKIGSVSQILWICYFCLILIGMGILSGNDFLVMSQIYILFIPLIFWDVDFIYHWIFQEPLWGISDYFFVGNFDLGKIISLQHLATIPMTIYSLRLMGPKRKDAWKLSVVQIIAVYLLTNAFFPGTNINCISEPCVNFNLGLPYVATWFLAFFTMIFISVLVINGFFFRKSKFKERFM
ncbi:hypothetical protein HY449_01785 [Candidatus Pacearchaeota archaeon]|nr:hypothetical protein [Candidatus Pacearchaeota archaeon]